MIFRGKLLYLISVVFLGTMTSCGMSLEDDAKEAAELTLKSLKYIESRNLQKSEEMYLKSREIQQKHSDNSEAFYNLYMTFLEEQQDNK